MITMRRRRFYLELLQQFTTRLLYVSQYLPPQRNIFGLPWQTHARIAPMIMLYTGLMLAPVEHAKATEIVYTPTQLDIIPMGSTRIARGANDNGLIVGTIGVNPSGSSGVIWNEDKQREILRSQGNEDSRTVSQEETDYSSASDINNSNQIVGSMNTLIGMRAFRSQGAGEPVFLEMLPGDTSSNALAISESGMITGWSSGPTGIRAVVWDQAGKVQALSALPDSNSCRGLTINNNGDVAGVCKIATGPRATLWLRSLGPDKRVIDLGTLPGDSWSEASSINERGTVVGTSGDTENRYSAVYWPLGNAIKDLGTLPNHTSSKALAVNNENEVVGVSEDNSGEHVTDERAFVWTKQRGMQDLNELQSSSHNSVLSHAIAISAHGLITATGHTKDIQSASHAHGTSELPLKIFQLSPVSEKAN